MEQKLYIIGLRKTANTLGPEFLQQQTCDEVRGCRSRNVQHCYCIDNSSTGTSAALSLSLEKNEGGSLYSPFLPKHLVSTVRENIPQTARKHI